MSKRCLYILLIIVIFVCGCSSSNKDIPTYDEGYQDGYDEGYLNGCDDGYYDGWYDCYSEVSHNGEFRTGAQEALGWVVESIPLSTYTEEEFEEFIYICDYVGRMDDDYLESLKEQYNNIES